MENQWTISVSELDEFLASSQAVLVDVREPEETVEGQIPGAVLIPLGEVGSQVANRLSTEQSIVFYCAHGIRSLDALFQLRLQGYQKLKSLEGGIAAWYEKNSPSN